MFFSFFRRKAISFFIVCAFFFPAACFAFEVSPSVSDISFFEVSEEITQVISVVNTGIDKKTYEVEVKLVDFASDGSIVGFSDVPSVVGVYVFPEVAEVLANTEQVFTVEFSYPEKVTADQVFGLVIHEKGLGNQQLSSAFVALMFPKDVPLADVENFFRIDAFTIISLEGALQAVAQFTNTGGAVVKPTSILIAQDIFGRELVRWVFADQAGRLPAGTTRIVTDMLPYDHFGFWHVGGPVSFSLLSVANGGGAVQQASVELVTIPGAGVIAGAVCVALFFVGGVTFLLKRRGILRT